MNILVPVKSVIDVELNIRVRDGAIVEDGMNFILSKWDENALEAALLLKEGGDGEITAVTVGPDRAGEALRKALAMGADKGIHINDPRQQRRWGSTWVSISWRCCRWSSCTGSSPNNSRSKNTFPRNRGILIRR